MARLKDIPRARVRRGRTLGAALAAVALVAALAPAGAGAHGTGALGVDGVSEEQLRAFETDVLGPTHAAEHASLRRQVRWEKRHPREAARKQRRGRVLARAALGPPQPPAQGGQWDPARPIAFDPTPGGVMGINAILLPTGKVLWYSYPNEPDSAPRRNESWAALWNTADGSFKRVDPPIDPDTALPANIWCSGASFLQDGRVLITGGNYRYFENPNKYAGLKHVYTFNPFTESWQRHEDMAHGRWYPSQLLMPDGRTFIVQGLDEYRLGNRNYDLELFDPLRPLGTEIDKIGTEPVQGDYYPHVFWMRSGRGLVVGPEKEDSWFFNVASRPSTAFSWRDAADADRQRTWGNAVLLPSSTPGVSNQVLQIGGAQSSLAYEDAYQYNTETGQVFTDDGAGGSWRPAASWNVKRSHANTVVLPDDSLVTVGGGVGSDSRDNRLWSATGEERAVELYDPGTGQWRLGNAQAEKRAYHSTALLLPDGSVVSAGDDRNGGFDQDSYEIYKPPYFFKGPRPQLASAPAQAGYGRTIWVDTPNADVSHAVLIAPGAGTHAVDMNQRSVRLQVSRRADGRYDIATPADGNVAPPGYYMLFLVDSKGIPSTARFVWLSPTAADQAPPGGGGGSGGGTPPPPQGERVRISLDNPWHGRRRGSVRRLTGSVSGTTRKLRVQVAVRKPKRAGQKGCRVWSKGSGRFVSRTSCRRPLWITTTVLLRSRSTTSWRWTLSLEGSLRRGRYVVSMRAMPGAKSPAVAVATRSIVPRKRR